MSVFGTCLWTGIILVSVLVHEYGHALTALLFGQRAHIDLIGMGGVTQRQGAKLKLWQDFVIVMNGPVFGLLLSLAANLLYRKLDDPNSVLGYILFVTYSVNLFWTVINLLPIQPLDGGHLLRIILEALFGLKGIKIALFCSMVLAGLLSAFFFVNQIFLAGALFILLTFESYRSWKASLAVQEQDQNFILQHLLKEAEKDIKNGYRDQAIHKLEKLREMTKAGVIFQTATQYLANLLSQTGEFRKAYEMLSPISSKLDLESLRLLHQLAYRNNEWKAAATFGNQSYQAFPNYETALINAFSYSLLGEVRPAIGWLQCAIREGLPNLPEVLKKEEFDKIRNDPLFQGFKNQSS